MANVAPEYVKTEVEDQYITEVVESACNIPVVAMRKDPGEEDEALGTHQ